MYKIDYAYNIFPKCPHCGYVDTKSGTIPADACEGSEISITCQCCLKEFYAEAFIGALEWSSATTMKRLHNCDWGPEDA